MTTPSAPLDRDAVIAELTDRLRAILDNGTHGTLCWMPFEGVVLVVRLAYDTGFDRGARAAAPVRLEGLRSPDYHEGYKAGQASERAAVVAHLVTRWRALSHPGPGLLMVIANVFAPRLTTATGPSKVTSVDKQFDLTDAIAAIEANLAHLKANATPEIKYEWQLAQEREEALELEAERCSREALRATGLAAHYKRALDSIASRVYYTSEGVAACTIAKLALVDSLAVESNNNE